MAAANLGIDINIRGTDFASGALRSAGKGVGRLQKRTMNFGAAAIKVFGGVTAAVVAMKGVMSITNESRAFEFELAKIGGLMGKTVSQLDDIAAAAEKASLESTFSPTESITGMKSLITMGFEAKSAIGILTPALQLAEAAGIGVGQATSTVGSALKIFGLEANKAADVTGKLFAAQGRSAISADQMQIALANVAGGANSAQQGIDSVLLSIGLLKNTGVEASVAGSQVGIAMSKIAKNSKHFEALGVNLLDGNNKIKQMPALVLEVSKALDKNFTNPIKRAQAISKLFGERGKKAFIGIEKQLVGGMKNAAGEVVKGQAAIDDFNKSLIGGEAQLAAAADGVRATLKGQLDLLEGSFGLAMKKIGDELASAMKPAVSGVIDNLNLLIGEFEALPDDVKSSIGKTVGAVGGLIAVSGIVFALGSALGLLGAAALPVVAIAIALGFAFAATTGDAETLSGTVRALGNFVNVVKSHVLAFWGALKAGATSVMPEVESALGGLVDELGSFSGDTSTATNMGSSFGKALGRVAVFVIKTATAVLKLINFLSPLFGWVASVIDKLGGFETILWAVQARLVFMAGVAIANAAIALGTMTGAALTSAGAMGVLKIALIAVATGQVKATLAAVAVSIAATGKAALIATGPVALFGAAFLAWVVVLDQIVKLFAEIKEFGEANFLNEVERDLGLITEGEYQKRFEEENFATGDNYDKFFAGELQKSKFKRDTAPSQPLPGFAQQPGFQMVGAQQADPSAQLDQLIANTKSQVAPTPPGPIAPGAAATAGQTMQIDPASIAAIGAAARKSPAPITKATLTVDGQVLGEIVANHQSGGANSGSVVVDIE